MLLEGMANDVDRPHAWKDFSGAMFRHAVDDALRSLPHEDTQVVKLAYFGGYSNRAIAERVGLTESTVQRRLRRALTAISEHIQHGRALGRRAAFAVMVWLSGRWLTDGANHLAQAATVASFTVIVAAESPMAPAVAASPAAAHAQTATVHSSAPIVAPVVQAPSVRLPVAIPAPPPLKVEVKLPEVKLPSL